MSKVSRRIQNSPISFNERDLDCHFSMKYNLVFRISIQLKLQLKALYNIMYSI